MEFIVDIILLLIALFFCFWGRQKTVSSGALLLGELLLLCAAIYYGLFFGNFFEFGKILSGAQELKTFLRLCLFVSAFAALRTGISFVFLSGLGVFLGSTALLSLSLYFSDSNIIAFFCLLFFWFPMRFLSHNRKNKSRLKAFSICVILLLSAGLIPFWPQIFGVSLINMLVGLPVFLLCFLALFFVPFYKRALRNGEDGFYICFYGLILLLLLAITFFFGHFFPDKGMNEVAIQFFRLLCAWSLLLLLFQNLAQKQPDFHGLSLFLPLLIVLLLRSKGDLRQTFAFSMHFLLSCSLLLPFFLQKRRFYVQLELFLLPLNLSVLAALFYFNRFNPDFFPYFTDVFTVFGLAILCAFLGLFRHRKYFVDGWHFLFSPFLILWLLSFLLFFTIQKKGEQLFIPIKLHQNVISTSVD